MIFTSDLIADFAASPGQVDDASPVVLFATTTQNALELAAAAGGVVPAAATVPSLVAHHANAFVTFALALALAHLLAAAAVAATAVAGVCRWSKLSDQRQLR